MVFSLAQYVSNLDQVAVISEGSAAAMANLSRFQMDISGSLGAKTQSFRLFVNRGDSAQVQVLESDGRVSKEVIVGPKEEILADYDLSQRAIYKRDPKGSLQESAIFRIPAIDPIVYSPLDKNGWTRYLKEAFANAKGWKAVLKGNEWQLTSVQRGGGLSIRARRGDLLPLGITVSSARAAWVWTMTTKPLPREHQFVAKNGTRLVQEIGTAPEPRFLAGDAASVVRKIWKRYDAPAYLAVEAKEEDGSVTRVLWEGFRYRQTSSGGDWSYDGRNLSMVSSQGRFQKTIEADELANVVGDRGARMDPTFGPMYQGVNPFRRIMSYADVKLDGTVELPGGKTALISVKNDEYTVTIAARVSDGLVLSMASLPHTGAASTSSQRTFRYLDSKVIQKEGFTPG